MATHFATSKAASKALLQQNGGSPHIQHVALLGFHLHAASPHVAAWQAASPGGIGGGGGGGAARAVGANSAAANSMPALGYRSTQGFFVPKTALTRVQTFSLRRALGTATSNGAGSSAGSSTTSSSGGGGWSADVAGFTCKGFMAGGGKAENQDRAVVVSPFARDGALLIGVLDGHGTFGHLVSGFLSRHLPQALYRRLACGGGGDNDLDSSGSSGGGSVGGGGSGGRRGSGRGGGGGRNGGPKPPLVLPADAALAAPFAAAFADADRLLCGSGVDVLESGSTAVVCHVDLDAGRIATAWCGDSRAVLVARAQGGGGGGKGGGKGGAAAQPWRAVALSDDHKPERPDEKLRVLLNGGRVEQLSDALGRRGGPHRVWFSHIQYPGLAMSRAFGDLPCRRLGVSPDPEVTVVDLGAGWGGPGKAGAGGGKAGGGASGGEAQGEADDELMLVVASDGVWEYMTNDDAAEIAAAAPDAAAAARALVAAAADRWRGVDPAYIDDITAVVARLRRRPPPQRAR